MLDQQPIILRGTYFKTNNWTLKHTIESLAVRDLKKWTEKLGLVIVYHTLLHEASRFLRPAHSLAARLKLVKGKKSKTPTSSLKEGRYQVHGNHTLYFETACRHARINADRRAPKSRRVAPSIPHLVRECMTHQRHFNKLLYRGFRSWIWPMKIAKITSGALYSLCRWQ